MRQIRITERGVEEFDSENKEWHKVAFTTPPKGNATVKPNNKTMKYKVTTEILEVFDFGDILTETDNDGWFYNKDGSEGLKREVIERNPDWFEPVEEFDIGEWVKNGHGQTLFRYHPEDVEQRKGFNMNGEWSTIGFAYDHQLTKATTPEIGQALKAEAKRRGFHKADKIKCAQDSEIWEPEKNAKMEYLEEFDELVYDNLVYLYKKGQWAQIVDQTPTIEINGYESEYFDEYVKWGCAEVDKELFLVLDNLNKRYEGRKNVTSVTIGEGTFTMEQISQIADYYKDKEDDSVMRLYDKDGNVTVRFRAGKLYYDGT